MKQGSSIRVLIADDHAAVRDALAALIEHEDGLELVASAADVDEAIELAAHQQPDVALVDLRMPGGGGIAAARGIAARSPRTRILALSALETFDNAEFSFSGYIRKGSSNSVIVDSVRRTAMGRPSSAV